MKRKVTNDEIEKILSKLAEKIRNEMDYDLRVAQSQMNIAEKDLVDTFNE